MAAEVAAMDAGTGDAGDGAFPDKGRVGGQAVLVPHVAEEATGAGLLAAHGRDAMGAGVQRTMACTVVHLSKLGFMSWFHSKASIREERVGRKGKKRPRNRARAFF